MHNTLLPSTGLTEFYRFALLLTGHPGAAERVIAAALCEAEERIGDIRDEAHRAAWLATRIRQRCLEEPAQPSFPEAAKVEDLEPQPLNSEVLARHFQALPEPERSALALFYLDPFTPDQIGQLLGMKLDQLAETLSRARSLLQCSLRPVRQTA